MSTNTRLTALNETALVEVGQSFRSPVRMTYSNRFYGTCVISARLRKSPTGAPELVDSSISYEDLEVRRGSPEALKLAAEAFLMGQLQKNPECFTPQVAPAEKSATQSILEPALRQLRRLTP